jgi:hypothetical protein
MNECRSLTEVNVDFCSINIIMIIMRKKIIKKRLGFASTIKISRESSHFRSRLTNKQDEVLFFPPYNSHIQLLSYMIMTF